MTSSLPKKDTQITGNIGLYYACYRLSVMGWNAMPTARNAKGIDILAYNGDYSKILSFQVKTLSKRAGVPIGKSLDNVMGDFWLIINDVEKEPKVYILTPAEVKEMAHSREKNGKVSYWLKKERYEQPQFHEAWGRF